MGAPDLSDPEMREIFDGFVIETRELCDNLSQELMDLENSPDDMELLNKIFRGIHTIKGTSAFMGYDKITEITHHGEDILNKLRRGEMHVTLPIIDVLLEVHDWVETLMDKLQDGTDDDVDYSETIATIDRLKSDTQEDVATDQATPPEEPMPDNAFESVLNNKDLVSKPGDFTDEELALLDKAFAQSTDDFFSDVSADKTEISKDTNEETKAGSPTDTEPKKDNEPKLALAASEETKTSPAPSPAKPSAPAKKPASKTTGKAPVQKGGTESIRVDIERVETLMDLSGELVLGRNRLAQIKDNLEDSIENKEIMRELAETTSQIDLVTSDIQTAVMRMRMVPIKKLYQKAPRIVRDLSKEFNKKIKLVVYGEETEIDRGIIEELNDPLVHMIRNSCDHGIEDQAARQEAGKPAIGTITLDADQEGNAIVLKISDDGRGMDPEKLKAKALEKGLITQDQAASMTRHEILQLIFAPGFSTAKKVTSVSGRGVGMDVVRTNIQNLKGMIEIESELGKGSTFVIKLPLTLAIIQGLLVRIQNETYAIPLSSVVEVVSIEPSSISSINSQEVIRIRKEDVWPLVRLDKALGSNNIIPELDDRYVVVVGIGTTRIGLVVDELMGQQEIVIKSIGEYLGQIRGIAGSTILGDGKVIMIIDIAELVKEANTAQLL